MTMEIARELDALNLAMRDISLSATDTANVGRDRCKSQDSYEVFMIIQP
jgi:hypothetical protein